jgi:hypothetical protein
MFAGARFQGVSMSHGPRAGLAHGSILRAFELKNKELLLTASLKLLPPAKISTESSSPN